MFEILKIHDEVLELLFAEYNKNRSFKFTLRRSNRGGRLDEGYWFYGNEEYLAVSFWTGMDWKNKTPNINFVILKTGETYLEICVSDSELKKKFIETYLHKQLELKAEGNRFKKLYSPPDGNYLSSLRKFIRSDKLTIDKEIQENRHHFGDSKDLVIDFISDQDFEDKLFKIETYKSKQKSDSYYHSSKRLVKISSFEINNYGRIDNIYISSIPFDAKWIFLTGENGVGKTSILKALSKCLCLDQIPSKERKENPNFYTHISLYLENGEPGREIFNTDDEFANYNGNLIGFASYGPIRLRTKKYSFNQIKIANRKVNLSKSIYNHDTSLINLDSIFNLDSARNNATDIYEKRKEFIKEVLYDIIPNLEEIVFEKRGKAEVLIYKEASGKSGVEFEKLSSGTKNIIAMIADMMVRLFYQQQNIVDPSELQGIVLIDEIDIHLHPKLQRELVTQLSKTFPKVQFIATTHSPIPLLGAPEGSVFLTVKNEEEKGVRIDRLFDLENEIKNLLPNAIYSSDLFDFEEIIAESNKNEEDIITTDNYKDIKLEERLKEQMSFLKANDKDFLKELGLE